MLTFDCPPSRGYLLGISWDPGPALALLPSCPQGCPHICPVWCRAFRHPPGPLCFSVPSATKREPRSCPLQSSGRTHTGSERPEAPCREQVSLLLQLLTCSSVRAAGRTLRLRNSRNGVGLGRLGAPQGHACRRHRKWPGGALGLLPVPAASPLSGSGQFSDLNCRSAPLAPARTPDWSFSLANLGNMPTF